jgi:hypothetical protein
MKKRWIPFIALTSIVIFAGGILFGSATEADQQSEFWASRMEIQSTVAVVNSDVGAIGADGERVNYSAAIIQELEDVFTQASPAFAETGFLDGTFGAVITFPSDVSVGVMSFNAGSPQRVQLEFMINPNKPEGEYIETFLRILNLQKAINTAMAHGSIGSAFEQFHAAQEQVLDIFQNKEDKLATMNMIGLDQFTPALNLDYIPEVPFEAELFDSASHLSSVEGFGRSVAGLYLSSYSQASSSFLAMRGELLPMADAIPEIADNWLGNLGEWSTEWEEYGEALRNYEGQTAELAGNLNRFIRLLDAHLDEVDALTLRANNYIGLLDDWQDTLSTNYDRQGTFLGRLEAEVVRINDDFVVPKNIYIEYLMEWYDDLREGHDMLEGWQNSQDWISQLGTRQGTLQGQVGEVGPRPTRGGFPATEEGDALYEAAVTAWRTRAVAASVATMVQLTALSEELERELPPIFDFNTEGFGGPDESIEDAYTSLEADDLGSWIVDRVTRPDDLEVGPFEDETPEPLNPFDHDIPEEVTPESADGFLVPLSDLRGQLDEFDMDVFITSDLFQGVEEQLAGFGTYLDFVRDGLGFHVEGNNMLLSRIYFEYINYLIGLRQEAFAAESYEIDNLHNRLGDFYGIHNTMRQDITAMLSDFAGVMPESRTEAGINRELIEHTISPFEFTPPVLRGEVTADMFGGATLYDRFGRFLWIVVPLLLLVFLVTLASHLVSNKKKKE